MAGQDSKTGSAEENDAARKDAAAGDQKNVAGTEGAEHAAARRPVRSTNTKASASAAQKGKPQKANQGNRSSRSAREEGANKKAPATDPDKEEEEEEEEDKRSADKFWQYVVAASYASRKTRGDWGGGESD